MRQLPVLTPRSDGLAICDEAGYDKTGDQAQPTATHGYDDMMTNHAKLKGKIIPVIRTKNGDNALKLIEILADAGIAIFEVTLTIPDAVPLIARLCRDYPDRLIGAGTILTQAEGQAALAAGAQFMVSPAAPPGLLPLVAEHKVPFYLGGATASEILAAHQAGADAVKIFPAKQLGGAEFLRAIKSVYPKFDLMPTGGIGLAEASDYFAAGAYAVGMGGGLSDEKSLMAGDVAKIRAAAAQAMEIMAKQ
ncbi:MAG: bifunctional 4-hydroxy-2-oxoglutarate aldolase/2-dehydro-3-deoxy-phosphogluconate aldolase [Candidatus Symbiobacter sp.]|nr:bifunctional 4-hydroxy-2-oxoglutarate aldolase/2-dehydro-3-deoxy-phosphogluconate aldolase [Candidatus Symbiobacter sp.]